MDESSDDAAISHSQQAHLGGADLIETQTSDTGNDDPAIEEQVKDDLRQALKRQELNHIDEIFENNPSLVNTQRALPSQETPLQFAIREGLKTVASHLLQRPDINDSINQADRDGFLPLHRALSNEPSDDGDILEVLIGRTSPSRLTSKTNDGDTVLHLASRTHRLDAVEKLCPMLERGIIDSQNTAGYAAIYDGIGSWEVVKCLLDHGASRVLNKHGDTLLHAAVDPRILNSAQGFSTGRALLAYGVDLDERNIDGNTVFHLVASNLNSVNDKAHMTLPTLQELLDLRKEAPYHKLTKASLVDALQRRNMEGDTMLHLIASEELDDDLSSEPSVHPQSMKRNQAAQAVKDVVLACPEILDIDDRRGNTPLHKACLINNWPVVEALIHADKRPASDARHTVSRNKADDIPLHLAVRAGHLEATKKLMTADQSLEQILFRKNDGKTFLHVAAGQGQPEILEELLERLPYERFFGADKGKNLRDDKDMTPLHMAAGRSSEREATRLVDAILKWCPVSNLIHLLNEVENTVRWTALHFAANRGHERIIDLLILNGADSRKLDNDNRDAAEIARQANHFDTADFILQYQSRRSRLLSQNFSSKLVAPHNKEVVDFFLALSWPKWDKAVQQLVGGPPQLWPHQTPVRELIFDAHDTYCQPRELRESTTRSRYVYLAPIHQAQICLSSCVSHGWMMKEMDTSKLDILEEKIDVSHWGDEKRDRPTYFYDPKVLQVERRPARWIHFPANNRAWIENLCRCMYSHGSLYSELIGILKFIDEYFEEVEGSQNYRYRRNSFASQALEKITDLPPDGDDAHEDPEATSAEGPAAKGLGHGKQSAGRKRPGERYWAYSLVFPLLDMDFINPGFCHSPQPEMENRSEKGLQQSLAVEGSLRKRRRGSLSQECFPPRGKNRESLMQTHWENMKALGEEKTVHLSRSLDHYCHQRISREELKNRVEDQVLTKVMERHLFKDWEVQTTLQRPNCMETFWNLMYRLRVSTSRSHDTLQAASSLEKGTKGVEDIAEPVENANSYSKAIGDTQTPLQILVAPQLWLWRFDNLVITSFPERWDCTEERDTLLKSIRKRVEDLDVDIDTQPNRLITEILQACAEFQPTLTVRKQRFTWTEAFEDEILSLSRDIKRCYAAFQDNLGKSDEKFHATFRNPTKYLRSIDDVLDELTSIRRVFQDQIQVWGKVHSGDKSCLLCNGCETTDENRDEEQVEGNEGAEGNEQEEGSEREEGNKSDEGKGVCASNALLMRSLESTLRLEEDALKVRESVVTLLTLLQGEASTENALKASEQSKILAVFTVVTVIFSLRDQSTELSPHMDHEGPWSGITYVYTMP